MPLYGTTLPEPARIYPGQQYALFDGTETPGAGVKSVVFRPSQNNGILPSGMVFTVDFALAPTATVQVQGANTDIDANYQILSTISTQHGYYSDLGEFAFYRAVLSTYSAGGMPVVAVNR